MGITTTSETTAIGNKQASNYRRLHPKLHPFGQVFASVKPLEVVTRTGYNRIVPDPEGSVSHDRRKGQQAVPTVGKPGPQQECEEEVSSKQRC